MRALILLCFFMAGPASAITITFDDINELNFRPDGSVASEGFMFSGDFSPSWNLGFMATNNTVSMEPDGGEAFLASELQMNVNTGIGYITGYLSSGGTVQTTVEEIRSFITVDLSSWGRLDRLEFGGVVAIDNISATVVPLPAAVWLFGSAFAALGFFRRETLAQ